jgi:Arc/MetJ family transcription regulator
MARTNIDIDDELIGDVMRQYGIRTKREAVEFALRSVRRKALTFDEIKALAGTGFWDGDPVAAGLDPEEFPELFAERARNA